MINVSDEQLSVPNRNLAVLDDSEGWLDDEHISAVQHLLQDGE